MDADLDLLLIAVFCAADDLLPARTANAKRMVTDAEVVTLAVAQQLWGMRSEAQFAQIAPRRLGHRFPQIPKRPGYVKRRQHLSDVIEMLISRFGQHTAGGHDSLLVIDSTPIECARSVKQRAAAHWPTPPTTATAPATAASSGASGCTASSAWTAPHARLR